MTTHRDGGPPVRASTVEHRGPVPAFIGTLVQPFYRFGISRANRRFDRGIGVVTFPVPVVSVGNLTVGGTGKTPMVKHICRELLTLDIRPCIAMRGYGARSGTPSDEHDEYTRAFPDMPIVAQPDRISGIRALLDSDRASEIDCVVLDDGFQHRQIARQYDIVLIDASRPIHRDTLLPKGWMRESLHSLDRADAIALTRIDDASELDNALSAVRTIRPDLTPILASHVWTDLRCLDDNTDRSVPVSWLSSRSVFAVSAIGNPESFHRQCENHAQSVVGTLALRDHDPYDDATVCTLIAQAQQLRADCIITTDKDWSKLRHVHASRWPCPVLRTTVAVHLDNPSALTSDLASIFGTHTERTTSNQS